MKEMDEDILRNSIGNVSRMALACLTLNCVTCTLALAPENLTTIPVAIMASSSVIDFGSLGTPENCVADFCLIPVFFQLRLHGFRSNRTAARNRHGIGVTGSCRSSALDAEEQLEIFYAFRRNDGG